LVKVRPVEGCLAVLRAITAVLVPAVLPMLVVVVLQVPIGKLVVTILKTLA